MNTGEIMELISSEFCRKTNLVAPFSDEFNKLDGVDKDLIIDEFKKFRRAFEGRIFSSHYEMRELLESIRENYGANDALGIEIDKVLSRARG